MSKRKLDRILARPYKTHSYSLSLIHSFVHSLTLASIYPQKDGLLRPRVYTPAGGGVKS